MLKDSFPWKLVVGAVALSGALVAPAVTHADPVTLSVQSLTSSLTLSGSIGITPQLPYVAQAAGSLTAPWSGTISADLTAGVFTFSGGSSINALVTGNYTTAPNPIGVEAGNYGVTASGTLSNPPLGASVVNGVYKNLILDITTGTAQNGLAPSGVTMKFNAGALDFGIASSLGNIPGTSTLTGSGANTSAALVTWDGTTLTLPVTFQTTGGNGRIENWNGTLTATLSAVPEPSTMALIGILGVGGLGYVGYNRRRHAKLAHSR